MKAVFDTNVLLAAFLTEGICTKLLTRARKKQFQLFISPDILREFDRVLSKKFLSSAQQIREAHQIILEAAHLVEPPSSPVKGVCRDPDDDRILSCAVAAKADYLVSGDSDLLELQEFQGIKMFSPRAFEMLFED
ncbi:MAG: putative toxin-antitoxin system toxin component, PIN family [Thermodesulfobacteriota bacterium]|nr:putative toxin-antitoxin system toxin component, PIN family [Thermodesulfobacteriota bacterium]